MFFNAPFFKRSVIATAEAAGPELKWLVMDLIPVTMIDLTGLQVVADVATTLQRRGITLVAAGRQTEWSQWAEKRNIRAEIRFFPTLREAATQFRREHGLPDEPQLAAAPG